MINLNIKTEELEFVSISDKTRKALEKIGLTGYEIRTFAALLKTGEMTASDPKPKIGRAIFQDLRGARYIRGEGMDWQ